MDTGSATCMDADRHGHLSGIWPKHSHLGNGKITERNEIARYTGLGLAACWLFAGLLYQYTLGC